MNNGVDPVSNNTIVSSDIITHAANGVSVSAGTGDFPELVRFHSFALRNSELTRFIRVLKFMGARNGAFHTVVMKPLNIRGIIPDITHRYASILR